MNLTQNLSLVAFSGSLTFGSVMSTEACTPFTTAPSDGGSGGEGGDGGQGGGGGEGGAVIIPGGQYVPATVRPAASQTLPPARAFLLWQAGAVPQGQTASGYDVCWASGDVSSIDDEGECPNAASVGTTYFVIDPLQAGTNYYWKVRARYQGGATSAFSPLRPFASDETLSGWWVFGGDAADASGHGHTGALQNGASYGAGKIGQSLRLDGVDGFMAVADADSLDFGTGDFSVAAWAYPERDGAAEALLAKRSGTNGWELYRTASGNLAFFGANCGNAAIGGSLSKGAWHHVAVSRNQGAIRLAVGGVTVGTGTCADDFLNGAALAFGCNGPDSSCTEKFQGRIDEAFLRSAASDEAVFLNAFCADSALAGVDPWPGVCQ